MNFFVVVVELYKELFAIISLTSLGHVDRFQLKILSRLGFFLFLGAVDQSMSLITKSCPTQSNLN
jgi:hypothetical protein